MFRIHKEGKATILISIIFSIVVWWLFSMYLPGLILLAYALILFLMVTVLQFFRNPERMPPNIDENILIAPADGKVVVIEKVIESEIFKEERMLVSIFMSPINVHVNRNPVSGKVIVSRYHPGKYLAAWNPKSSTENERTTVVYQHAKGNIMIRQVAGALARRIVNYLKEGDEVKRGHEMGFIKFGSRVDIYLPLNAEILVTMDQVVSGNISEIALLK
jgi:phosphatidylserine decarboxylase